MICRMDERWTPWQNLLRYARTLVVPSCGLELLRVVAELLSQLAKPSMPAGRSVAAGHRRKFGES